MLEVRGLEKWYAPPGAPSACGCVPARQVLRDVDFRLSRDQTLAVVGPSGCGKTTLLYALCGLARPDAGQVLLDGEPVRGPGPGSGPGSGGEMAIILQDYGLLPWKTVLENVALGLKIRGVGRAERNAEAARILADMGLAGREADYPARLSGGEQQRVAIARAYALRPKLLLMDEPFSSLDAITRERLQETLLATWRTAGVPFLLVTHSVEEAAFLGRRILVMAGSPATIVARFDNPGCGAPGYRGAPEFYERVREVRAAMDAWWRGGPGPSEGEGEGGTATPGAPTGPNAAQDGPDGPGAPNGGRP